MAGMICMKTMMVTVFDVGPTMGLDAYGDTSARGSPSKLAIAKSFFASHLIERMIATKTTEFCVVTNGDDVTNNYLNQNQGGGYDRIQEIFPLRRAAVEMISTVHNLLLGTFPGDMIDGIVVGFDILDRTNVGKAFNKILFLITDGENEIQGLEDLNPIVENMKQKNCAVYILFLGKITKNSSINKIKNAGVLREISVLTRGRFIEANDLSECMPLLTGAPGLSSKPRQTKYVLEIAPYMRVPCVIWNKTKSNSLPSLKKAPIYIPNPNPNGYHDFAEHSGEHSAERSSVKTDVTWRNPADEDEEVSLENRIKGYKYGPQFIPMQGDEENATHVPGFPVIQLIGFVSSSTVPRHHYLLKAVVLEGNPDIPSAVSTVRSLHNTMLQSDTVAFVRFVSKQDSDPCLSVLIPNINEMDRKTSFIMHRLPVAEDIREYAYPSFNLNSIISEQRDSISQFITAMTINPTSSQLHPFNPTRLEIIREIQRKLLSLNAQKREKGIENEIDFPTFLEPMKPIKPEGKVPALQKLRSTFPLKIANEKINKKRIYWSDIKLSSTESSDVGRFEKVAKKDENEVTNKSEESNNLKTQESASTSALLAAASSAVQQFNEGTMNPVEEFNAVINVISLIGCWGRDITPGILSMGGVLSGVEAMYIDENRNKNGGSSSSSSGSGSGSATATASSTSSRTSELDPITQNAKRELVIQTMNVMTAIIQRLVTAGGSAAYHRKAIACLEVLRITAITENTFEIFNNFMKDVVKEIYSKMPRYKPFWSMVVEKGITLISNSENKDSKITQENALKFLSLEVIVVADIVKEVVIEDDDMFGEME